MEFEVKDASEIPDAGVGRRGRPSKYPFEDMQVGKAFLVPAGWDGNVRAAVSKHAKVHGKKFRTSTQPDGSVRVERIA